MLFLIPISHLGPLLEFNLLAVCLRAINIDSAVEGPEVCGPGAITPEPKMTKFGHACLTTFARLAEIHLTITDFGMPTEFAAAFTNARRQVPDC